MVFVPFRLRGSRPLGPFGESLDHLLARLPSTILVLAAEDVDLDAEPEEGEAGQIAAAEDVLEDSRRAVRAAEKVFESIARQIETARQKLPREPLDPSADIDSDAVEVLREEIRAAEDRLKEAGYNLSKAKDKAEAASQKFESLGGDATGKEKA